MSVKKLAVIIGALGLAACAGDPVGPSFDEAAILEQQEQEQAQQRERKDSNENKAPQDQGDRLDPAKQY